MNAEELGKIEEHLLSLPEWPWFLAEDIQPKLVMVSDKERLKNFKKSLRDLNITSREEFETKWRNGDGCIDVSDSVICKEGSAATADTMKFVAKAPVYIERLVLALRKAWNDVEALKQALETSTKSAQEALADLQRAVTERNRVRAVLVSFRALLENEKR